MRKLKLKELGRKTTEEYKSADKLQVTVVLDNLRSAHNVGSVFRTADCLALERIILCGITAIPPSNDIRKTAIGATESVSWQQEKDIVTAVATLKEKGYKILGIEQTTESKELSEIDFRLYDKIAIILGNEVEGLNESILHLLDQAIEIKQFGTKHSLNVSVCAGMVLWEVSKQIRS